jgi:hypothetical protein
MVNTMADLSFAAQAVLDAAFTLADNLDRDVTESEMIAAALRAAVAHTQQHRGLGVLECDADELLAIASELDNNSTH